MIYGAPLARNSPQSPASGSSAIDPGESFRIQRLITPFPTVNATLFRQSVLAGVALFGTMGTVMFHSEAAGVIAKSTPQAIS